MLLTGFYTVSQLQQDEGSIKAAIAFNADHDIFKGHFPTIPVVPGVCMMQIVKEVLEQHLSQLLTLSQSSQIKFLALITPNENPVVDLKIHYRINGLETDVQAELFNSERAFFKMKALYKHQ
jgi:3-hydroxyacyl-[acyl-carrier-protein] dehydratase